MKIETLNNYVVDGDDSQILVIVLGDRLEISPEKLASLIGIHYKYNKRYSGYQLEGDTDSCKEEIKKLKKLLNWKEVPYKNPIYQV